MAAEVVCAEDVVAGAGTTAAVETIIQETTTITTGAEIEGTTEYLGQSTITMPPPKILLPMYQKMKSVLHKAP